MTRREKAKAVHREQRMRKHRRKHFLPRDKGTGAEYFAGLKMNKIKIFSHLATIFGQGRKG